MNQLALEIPNEPKTLPLKYSKGYQTFSGIVKSQTREPSTIRILICDDDPFQRIIFENHMQSLLCKHPHLKLYYQIFPNGESLVKYLSHIQESSPLHGKILMITDYNMGAYKNGLEIAKELRDKKFLWPIFMRTSEAASNIEIILGLNEGLLDNYFQKGNDSRLIKTIENHLLS